MLKFWAAFSKDPNDHRGQAQKEWQAKRIVHDLDVHQSKYMEQQQLKKKERAEHFPNAERVEEKAAARFAKEEDTAAKLAAARDERAARVAEQAEEAAKAVVEQARVWTPPKKLAKQRPPPPADEPGEEKGPGLWRNPSAKPRGTGQLARAAWDRPEPEPEPELEAEAAKEKGGIFARVRIVRRRTPPTEGPGPRR